jgi:hypothetical protein
MHVRPSELTAAPKASSEAASAASSGKAATQAQASFAGLLAHAATTPMTVAPAPTVSTGATTTTDTATSTTSAESAITLRKGETMTTVSGHAYAEIHGGKRDGEFVNTSHNGRRGEAFALVTKAGKELHVYGTGKDKLIVRVSPPQNPATPPAPIKLRDGETMTPVPGHHYAQIHGGSRDGMYVNTSRNSRRGEAFVPVTKNGVDYHVYGAGKDRHAIRVVPHDPGATVTAATTS